MKIIKKNNQKEESEIKKSKKIIKESKEKIKKEKQKIKEKRMKKILNSKIVNKIYKPKKENDFNLRKQILNMIYYEFLGIIFCLMILYFLSGGKNYFKLYHELYKVIETYDTITSNYYGKINKKKLIDSATSSMISSIDDAYTNYNGKKEKEDFEESLDSTYEGIGATVASTENGEISIVEVFKDSPAEKAGLKPKDIIKKIEDIDFTGKSSNDMANYIKTNKKDELKITIQRDNKEKEITIKRKQITVPTVFSKIIDKDNKKIGYINITVFSNSTTNQFKEQLTKLEKQKIKALIIDVRDNNGGYLKTATEVSSMFLKKGQVIYQLSDKKKTTKEKDKTKEHRSYPVAVIVNQYSASASEILTAAIKESYKGYVVGTKTYGKGTVQKVKYLKDGTMIKYTVQKWLTPKGNWINKKGITPTNIVKVTDIKKDEQLEYTTDILLRDLK